MPVVNNAVVFASGTLAQYTAATKSADTIYFITDTNQIFVGSDEYTKSYVTLLQTVRQSAYKYQTRVSPPPPQAFLATTNLVAPD